jgi:hypothetical protein
VYLPSADLSKCRFTGDSAERRFFQTQKGFFFFRKLVEESLAQAVVEKKERNEREKKKKNPRSIECSSSKVESPNTKLWDRDCVLLAVQTSRPRWCLFPSV